MYNKLIIFDLDGVLIDSREIHFKSLNKALEKVDPKYVISRDEHLSVYDGLPTTRKLQELTARKGLPSSLYNQIWRDKQDATVELYQTDFRYNSDLWHLFNNLRDKGYKIAVASNSIRETMRMALDRLGLLGSIDYLVSNEDVKRAKPYPEMYWQCMQAVNAIPSTTWIIEDSHIGRQGALDSGAHLIPVTGPSEVTSYYIDSHLNDLAQPMRWRTPWRDPKLNVVIPMAGAGSRFASAGYTFPKPLIEVNGKPMIQVVVENLNIEANYIFIVQKEHYEKYYLESLLNRIAPNCKIVQVDGMTEGAACTVLKASEYIENDDPLVLVNSDQYLEWNSNEVMYSFRADEIDAGILTFKATHPKWSYAKLDHTGFVCEIAEKRVISDNATCGLYYWKRGKDFVNSARWMILDEKNRVNGEWYVAPTFNEMIKAGKKIKIKQIDRMWGIGDPESLKFFLENYRDHK